MTVGDDQVVRIDAGSFELSVLIEAHLSAMGDAVNELITASDLDNELMVEEASTTISIHKTEADALLAKLRQLLDDERKVRSEAPDE